MEQNLSKHLSAAREARKERNYEDATRYYEMVKLDDPECAEARFFHPYSKLMDSTNGQAYNNFLSFESAVNSPLSKVMNTDLTVEENKELLKEMIEALSSAKSLTRGALRAITTEYQKYASEKIHVGVAFMDTLKKLGDDLEKKYGSNKEIMLATAVPAWKQVVDRLKKEEKEAVVAKIQKYDPTYTAPKSGCLSK